MYLLYILFRMKITKEDLKKSEKKRKEDILTTLVLRKVSIQITKILILTNVTPNQVTVFSFLIGVLAAYCFSTGQYWWLLGGGILLQLSYIFDLVDGEIARFKGVSSKMGAWLDEVLDRLKEILLFLGLSIGFYTQTGDWHAWLFGFVAAGSLYMTHVILDNTQKEFGNEMLGKTQARFFLVNWLKKFRIPSNYLTIGIGIYLAVISLGAILNQIYLVFLFFIIIQNLYWILISIFVWIKR